MKVSVDISSEYIDPYAVIYTDKVTDNIQRIIDMIGTNDSPIIAQQNNGDMVILQPHDIYMVRVENGETVIYTGKKMYRSRKILYEISRSTKSKSLPPFAEMELIAMRLALFPCRAFFL